MRNLTPNSTIDCEKSESRIVYHYSFCEWRFFALYCWKTNVREEGILCCSDGDGNNTILYENIFNFILISSHPDTESTPSQGKQRSVESRFFNEQPKNLEDEHFRNAF